MIFYTYKEFTSALQKLNSYGGAAQNKANKAYTIWGKAASGEDNPFVGIPVTNHGETRIEHCIKYDLGDGYRLVTVQDENMCMFCFAGKHDKTDAWIESHKGLKPIVDKGKKIETAIVSADIRDEEKRIGSISDFSSSKLIMRLDKLEFEYLVKNITSAALYHANELSTLSTENDIKSVAEFCETEEQIAMLYDVLSHLKSGDKIQALRRIDIYTGAAKVATDLSEEELIEINDGMEIKRLAIGSEEYKIWFGEFIRNANYQDWMLFMHPEQQRLVDADYDGSAKLSGVSGSGKTCIIVNRAIRLARQSSESKILITTLNKGLSKLITDLLEHACPDLPTRERVTCVSFFDLCREMLLELEPQNTRLYDEFTWLTAEHIEEVWKEYYRCLNNNDDAAVLMPLHKSLNSQSVDPEDYIKQEFDWLRSLCGATDTEKYLSVNRVGRAIGFPENHRRRIVEGMKSWQKKMEDVGCIDYIGIVSRLYNYRDVDHFKNRFTSILVDEAQDFGTIELEILRKLVPFGANDLFIAGDMAQQILPKHQSFPLSGIVIPGARSTSIRRNYRNSREILKAAYELFFKSMDHDVIMDGELQLLDPDYANFSSSKPAILNCANLQTEISFALAHLRDLKANRENFKGCLAIVGYTWLEIKRFADSIQFPMLDGNSSFNSGDVFISDLDQTKGYEFDTMCIVNCNDQALPSFRMPETEHFRDACKLYVAMTRAKSELILSYSSSLSKWLRDDNVLSWFETENWASYVDESTIRAYGTPQTIQISDFEDIPAIGSMTGTQFLYTRYAIGLSVQLQDKIEELINGDAVSRDGQRVRWRNIRSAYSDVLSHPTAKNIFGPTSWRKFVAACNAASQGLE